MNWKALAIAALVVVSSVGATMAVSADTASTQEATAYSGTHVSFDTTSNAITGYSVNNRTVVGSVQVQSREQAESSGDAGAGIDLGAVTSLEAAGISLQTKTETSATLKTDSGATIDAHDNDRGILVVSAGGERQLVHANVSSTGEASAESDRRVVVESDDGTTGTFLVVGDGQVTVNDRGNVTADLGKDARLVYRQYEGERSSSEKKQEELITTGKAAAEVYVQSAEASGSDAKRRTVDVVTYSRDTTVEVTGTTENEVEMTAERSKHEGRVVITRVSKEVVSSTDNVTVTVDGEAAARADSYSAVEAATNGGETSKFLVESSSSASASTDVVVGINHFSKHSVTVEDRGSGDGSNSGGSSGSDEQTTPEGGSSGSGPGFGVGVSVVALLGAALLVRYRA